MSRHLFALALCAAAGFALPCPVAASQAGAAPDNAVLALQKIHQLRLASQKSLAEFFMLDSTDGDQRYAKLMSTALDDASAQLKTLGTLPGPASTALAAQVVGQWQGYISELAQLTGTLNKQGFTDLQPVADMTTRNQKLNALCAQLYDKIREEGKVNVAPLTEQSRAQSLLMQSIAVNYASRSAAVGASFFGGEDQRPLDEMADQFAKNLIAMEQAPQNTSTSSKTLDAIDLKWRYIESSVKNYNQNSVPFLVNKYADRITEELESLPDQHATAQL